MLINDCIHNNVRLPSESPRRQEGRIGTIVTITQMEREIINNRFLRDKLRQAISLIQTEAATAISLAGLTGWVFYERYRAEEERNKVMALFKAVKNFSTEIIFKSNNQ